MVDCSRDGYAVHEAWPVNTKYPHWLSVNTCGHFIATGHVCPRRYIQDYLLIACSAGSGIYEIEGIPHPIRGGDIFVTIPGEQHAYHSDPVEGWEIRWVHFTGTLAAQMLQQAGFSKDNLILRAVGHRMEVVCGLLRRLCAICASSGPELEAEGSACLYETLLRLSGGVSKTSGAAVRNGAGQEEAEKRLLAAAEAEGDSVEDMARRAGMSKYHFIREFRRHFNITPWQYVVARRIARAKELLVTTDHPIKRIAAECGFGDPNFFSFAFRRETGQSATAFRQAYSV